MNELDLTLEITHEQEGQYLTLPFQLPEGTERLELSIRYEGRVEQALEGGMQGSRDVTVIDTGLIDPRGMQVGYSGSIRNEIYLSATEATPGYQARTLIPGEWRILAGLYRVAPEGATVHYHLRFVSKHLRLLLGDLHTHSYNSDGVLSPEELARHARRHGLDFVALTDHNQFSTAATLPSEPGLSMIAGTEWTTYQGHANFLGVDEPFTGSFFADDLAGVQAIFQQAHENGALITLNHPLEEPWALHVPMEALVWDCLEVWNGPMRSANLRTLELWHSMLAAGQRVVMCSGSDYHRDSPFEMLGGPTLCVYSASPDPADILAGVRAGLSYAVFGPHGPRLTLAVGELLPGQTAGWRDHRTLHVALEGLAADDRIRALSGSGELLCVEAASDGCWQGDVPVPEPDFVRIQVDRCFAPGLPHLPALLSNAVWLEG
ncbi:MAG: CehA/McbA family metallohydrolase [Chloroflexi bacterium]|nr:CehA/McbA family metallohydrolase [Chloroflexota bacterium]